MITFVSVFLNHHQLLLCEELRKYTDEFYFISTMSVSEERRALGYEDMDSKYDFVIKAYDEATDVNRLKEIILDSDVVIFGDCPDKYIEYRMRANKLSFFYSERFFKKGMWRRFIPKTKKKINSRILQFKNKNLYVLCASAFLSNELKLMGFDSEKCYKWGYFPKGADTYELPERNNEEVKLLWAGRLIDWKHPHHALKAAAGLKKKGYGFSLDIIGSGDCEDELKNLAKKLDLEDRVRFLGSMSPEEVLKHMKNADIFLATSDYKEGWGAVVNESMGAGCAVLASSAMGSVPFLIKDGENGLIYKYGDTSDFEQKLENLVKDKELRTKLANNSVETIHSEYNYKVAVKRLMEFIDNGCKDLGYENGPMSKAVVLENKWYK